MNLGRLCERRQAFYLEASLEFARDAGFARKNLTFYRTLWTNHQFSLGAEGAFNGSVDAKIHRRLNGSFDYCTFYDAVVLVH